MKWGRVWPGLCWHIPDWPPPPPPRSPRAPPSDSPPRPGERVCWQSRPPCRPLGGGPGHWTPPGPAPSPGRPGGAPAGGSAPHSRGSWQSSAGCTHWPPSPVLLPWVNQLTFTGLRVSQYLTDIPALLTIISTSPNRDKASEALDSSDSNLSRSRDKILGWKTSSLSLSTKTSLRTSDDDKNVLLWSRRWNK